MYSTSKIFYNIPKNNIIYLGPRIWDKHVSLQEVDETEEDFSVMNIDEFLEENNIQVNNKH